MWSKVAPVCSQQQADTTPPPIIFIDNENSPRLIGFELHEPNGEWRRAGGTLHPPYHGRTVILWHGGNAHEGIEAGYTLQCDEHPDDMAIPAPPVFFFGGDSTMPRLFDGDGSLIRIRLCV